MTSSNEIFEYISFLYKKEGVLINNDEIQIETSDFDNTQKILLSYDIKFDAFQNRRIHIPKYSLPINIFENEDDFYKNCLETDFTRRDTGIINYLGNSRCFYHYQNSKTFINNAENISDFIFRNSDSYFKLINNFRDKSRQLNNNLIDFNDLSTLTFTLISPKKHGQFSFKYFKNVPFELKNIKEDLLIDTVKFLEEFTQQNRIKSLFIKDQIIEILQQYPSSERISQLLKSIELILENANRNFEVYLLDFSFDEFKEKYEKQKEVYLENIRGTIGKITTQVASIPLVISASAFASYQAAKDPVVLIFILISFLIFTIYFIYLMNIYRRDIKLTESTFEREFNKLQTASKKVADNLVAARNDIKTKISIAFKNIILIQFIVIGLNGSFMVFILMKFFAAISGILLTSFTILIFAIIYLLQECNPF